ncbi:ATP-binding protein [Flavobacteriaceae bacterium Ap0902]|nr:ATP-binding protein [Flavobacteriaceae bacterium Ap0902]
MAKLNINVRSFSYKRGIPEDPSGNGGGFVFDCRGILNPGRIAQFKTKTGRDQEIIEYLEENTKMSTFLECAYEMIDITIADFIERGFTNLEINFGCTGGQHRSVYAADQMAKHIQEKYPVDTHVHIIHLIQEEKNWINETY